jgi:hypothetical protein
MKKLILSLLLLFASAVAFCQQVSLPKERVAEILYKTWEVKHVQLGAMKMKPREQSALFEFVKDTSVVIISNSFEKKGIQAKWMYNEQEKAVIVKRDGKEYMRITEINEGELVVKMTEQATKQKDFADAVYILQPKQ